MIPNELYTSDENSEMKYHVFDDNPLSNDYDEISNMCANERYKSVTLGDDTLHSSWSKSES